MKKPKTFKGSNSFLEHLEIEERRNSMLADLEADPEKKREAKHKADLIKKLRQRVKRMIGGKYETAAAGKVALEAPEQEGKE